MIGLKRNQRTFYCAPYAGVQMQMDGQRQYYRSPAVTYGPPVLMEGFVSSATGTVLEEVFGDNARYDKVIILYDPEADVAETSVLWVDRMPVLKEDGTTDTPHDYIIKRIARSLNMTVLATAKVEVSA